MFEFWKLERYHHFNGQRIPERTAVETAAAQTLLAGRVPRQQPALNPAH